MKEYILIIKNKKFYKYKQNKIKKLKFNSYYQAAY